MTYASGVHPAGLYVEGANGSGVTAARGLPSPGHDVRCVEAASLGRAVGTVLSVVNPLDSGQ